jgi:multisubunit Na+/H+ antiporter MnhF subunit
MSDDKNDRSGDWFGNPLPIVMVVLLAAGVVIKTDPLKSARPTDPDRVTFLSTSRQNVEARLWQDPFAAVEKYKKALSQAVSRSENTSPTPPTPDELREAIKERGSNVTVLAISLFGASYAEEAESRRRSRFAVISALGFHTYHPENADAIGYFRIDPLRRKSNANKKTKPYDDDVPFEWFKQDDTSRAVLVLWLKDEKLTATPLTTLDDLFNELTPPQPYKNNPNNYGPYENNLNFKLIGPAGSGALSDLVDERRTEHSALTHSSTIEVYSPSATISNCDLRNPGGFRPLEDCIRNPRSLPEVENSPIVRTIGTDDVLAAALLWELWQRGVNREQGDKGPCTDGLVLIGEQDTAYGRTLLRYLKDVFSERCKHATPVRTFSYLRGLDGVLPDTDKSSNTTPHKDKSGQSKDLREQLEDAPPEHAEGRNQFDYLRRLAAEIDQLDDDKSFAENGVKAVGLVGSDLYDKLLILQALRSRFKDKIFFTTDLDARYLHADQTDWARNLVVASHFGLALNPALQRGTLPFRDSYQTARYLATLMALDDKPIDHWTGKMKEWLRPQIFEIGRTEAIHLASPSVERLKTWIGNNYTEGRVLPAKKTACDGGWEQCNNIEPIWPSRGLSLDHPWVISFMICVGLLLLTLANLRVNETVRAASGPPSPERVVARKTITTVATVAVVIFTFLLLVLYEMTDSLAQGVGEPFVWLEGVSVWPSLVIRFVGLLTMLALWWVLQNSLRSQQTRIVKDFKIAMPHSRALSRTLSRGLWSAAWIGPHLNLASFDKDGKAVKEARAEGKVDVRTVWQNYVRATSIREKISWIAASLIIGLVFLAATFQIFDRPSFPHRGKLVETLHLILVGFNALVLWLTIFGVGYETRACTQFIEALSGIPNKWPDRLLARTERETGVPRAQLDDYLDFQLIVRATQRIEWLMHLPFVSLLFIVLARSNFFDAMDFPLPLVFVIGLALTYALHSAWLLNKRAKKMRSHTLTYYKEKRSTPAWPSLNTEPIDQLISRISNTREGAFVSLTQQPALQALLIPFGGYGGVQIIEYLIKLFGAF